jgi:hypothetical protein
MTATALGWWTNRLRDDRYDGAGISNSLLGIDDTGVVELSEDVNHCRMQKTSTTAGCKCAC